MPPGSPYAVEIADLTRRFGEKTALDRVSLSIRRGEFFSLLGPSGCGKTTLLRILAGLDIADSGTLRIAGMDAGPIPAHRRPVNTVFQSYALFPHLDVWENVAFGLRMKKVPRLEIEQRVERVMALVDMGALNRRRPGQLSGGEKQRVALARALVNEPEVLLLDEPLAALDLKLRKQLQIELRALQRRLGITFFYVTHDQEEAMVLSDRIAVMRQGRIEQLGDARSLYENPRSRFVSQFLGTSCLLEATLRQVQADGFVAQTALGAFRVAAPSPGRQAFTLAIRPERVRLIAKASGEGENLCRMRIERVNYVGAETHYELRSGGQTFQVEAMNTGPDSAGFCLGQETMVYLPPSALVVLDD